MLKHEGKIIIKIEEPDGISLNKQVDVSISTDEHTPISNTELIRLALEKALKVLPEDGVHKPLDSFDKKGKTTVGEKLSTRMTTKKEKPEKTGGEKITFGADQKEPEKEPAKPPEKRVRAGRKVASSQEGAEQK